MDDPENFKTITETEESIETSTQQHISYTPETLDNKSNFDIEASNILKDSGIQSEVILSTNNAVESQSVNTGSVTKVNDNIELGVFEGYDQYQSFGDKFRISNVEEDIITDIMDLIVNRDITPETKSHELLHSKFTDGLQVTDGRSLDDVHDMSRLVSSSTDMCKNHVSQNDPNQMFVDNILQSVQDTIYGRDDYASPQTGQRKLDNIPSDSSVSDIEIFQDCCSTEETKILPQNTGLRTKVDISSTENLDPDNPLMRRFQTALNAHLQRQKLRIAEELLEMEGNLRQSKKERESLATFMFSIKQSLNRQHSSLEKDKEKITKSFSDRQDVENLLKLEKTKHKSSYNLLQIVQNKQAYLQLEKDKLNAMLSQFKEWETNMNSELTRSQLISDKNKADKKLFAQEKMKQDLLLVNLSSEVIRLSTMFTELEKNIKDKQADSRLLAQAVIDGNVDLETLEHENKRLMQVWKVVIFRIQQRDKAYIDLKTEFLKAQDQFQSMIAQIESYKRTTSSEIKCNENLTLTLNRLEFDLETLERQRAVEEDKQRKLREMLIQTEDMIDFTQRDLNSVLVELNMKNKEISHLQRQIDKVLLNKYKYEDQVLNLLQRQLTNSKAENQANKHIRQLHEDCRQQEVSKSSSENDLAKMLLLIEHETKVIKENQRMLDEENNLEHERDLEIQSMEMELTKLERAIGTKQTRVDTVNIKVADIIAKTGNISELSPDEIYVKQLEKQIAEHNSNIEDLQIMWLREQNHIVALKQQRTSQLHQLNIFRKQVLIMDHKYFKLDQEIDKYRKDENNMKREIHSLEQKLLSLNEQCSQRRGYKDSLDNSNVVIQNQLICDLKDAEVASLTILEEMCQLEVDKEDIRKQLLETQREMLAWEKKVKLAAETKENMEKAKSEGGEIAVMKSEIHRMEVRCAQLHKVQEKLAQDMEMCVFRRDGIVDLAYAREKRATKGLHYNRQQFMRKLDDLRSKIRQTNSEIKSTDKSLATSELRLKDLTARVEAEKQQVIGLQEAVKIMEGELHEGNLHRHKNLELLVRKQRKARFYGELKTGRYIGIIKNEGSLELELQKQRTVNADLISVVESLNTDFPSLNNPIAQILNTLRSPAA